MEIVLSSPRELATDSQRLLQGQNPVEKASVERIVVASDEECNGFLSIRTSISASDQGRDSAVPVTANS